MASIGKADLVVFFVKAYHTEKAASDALVLQEEDTVFLTLQNGLGNEEVISRQVDPRKVILGVTITERLFWARAAFAMRDGERLILVS